MGCLNRWSFPGHLSISSGFKNREGGPAPTLSERNPLIHGDEAGHERVLDFSRILAGPHATRILADLGAEVIKIEPGTWVDENDDRQKGAGSKEKGRTPYFQTWNRNKKSIILNMNQTGAVDLLKRLVQCSDILVEKFSPPGGAELGIGVFGFP